ncbi:hypothetical protein IWZ01DRAFT_309125 [Phyllosticta capitalensis]
MDGLHDCLCLVTCVYICTLCLLLRTYVPLHTYRPESDLIDGVGSACCNPRNLQTIRGTFRFISSSLPAAPPSSRIINKNPERNQGENLTRRSYSSIEPSSPDLRADNAPSTRHACASTWTNRRTGLSSTPRQPRSARVHLSPLDIVDAAVVV